MFYMTMITSVKVMQVASVSTFVAMRACIPFCTLVMEVGVLGHPMPSLKSSAALILMAIGAGMYVISDSKAVMSGIVWIVIFLVLMPIDSLLIKHILNRVKLSPWGMAFHQNFLAACFAPVTAIMMGYSSEFFTAQNYIDAVSGDAFIPVLSSCCVGICLSYFSMNVRNCVTPTAFAVLAVFNKYLVVLFDKAMLNPQLSPLGVVGILMTISAAVLWQQAEKSSALSGGKQMDIPPFNILVKRTFVVCSMIFSVVALLYWVSVGFGSRDSGESTQLL